MCVVVNSSIDDFLVKTRSLYVSKHNISDYGRSINSENWGVVEVVESTNARSSNMWLIGICTKMFYLIASLSFKISSELTSSATCKSNIALETLRLRLPNVNHPSIGNYLFSNIKSSSERRNVWKTRIKKFQFWG